jgi:hypothetical protein
MKTQYRPIAMRCTQNQFESIKDRINLPIVNLGSFRKYPYLINYAYKGKSITHYYFLAIKDDNVQIYETFDPELFLDCCGREVEKKTDYSAEIEALQLEAKHILPYLAHGVEVEFFDGFENQKGKIHQINLDSETCLVNTGIGCYTLFHLRDIKPILKPLSDFYDINCPALIDTNFDLPTQLTLVDLCSKKQHYSGVSYSDMQEFFSEHIDVFDLITNNLAIKKI